jgi:hypothetical protein
MRRPPLAVLGPQETLTDDAFENAGEHGPYLAPLVRSSKAQTSPSREMLGLTHTLLPASILACRVGGQYVPALA